jgi:polyisoprenoid-binding protein YceI
VQQSEVARKPEAATVHYIVQTTGGKFTVKAFATGLLSAVGHSPTIAILEFTGDVYLDPDAIGQSSLNLVIPTAAMCVTDEINEKDRLEIDRRMHDEVLETDSFPEIKYACSRMSASQIAEGLYWLALSGDLTLHGVTRSQTVSLRLAVNGDHIRAVGECAIRLSDYDIAQVTAFGGTIRLKDELKIAFDIPARKQA